MRRIRSLSAVLVVLVVVHDLDHVRQGRAVSSELYGVGSVALVTALVTLILAVRRHRLAPAAATVVGFGNVLGLNAVHVFPHWSTFSDPYPAAHVDVLSWAILGAMLVVGLALGLAGLAQMRNATAVPA